MAQDRLAIALEHHRAGRLRQAAAGYRALLDAQPGNVEASHWLGVLAFQVGRVGEAIGLLEQATQGRADDAAYWHNLGQAYLRAGRTGDAVKAFERAVKLVPDRGQTLLAWGEAHLAHHLRERSAADAQAAVFAIRQAIVAGVDSAEAHHHLGVAQLAAGQVDEAITAFNEATKRKSDYASAWMHLAMAHRLRNDEKKIRNCLNKTLEIDANQPRAWYALATLDLEAENLEIAAGLFRKAVKADSSFAAAYQALGRVLERLGKGDEAMAAYREALRASRRPEARGPELSLDQAAILAEKRLTSGESLGLHHAIAAEAGVFPPARVPAGLVTDLFDRYAEQFDQHLRGSLEYAVPELIAQAVGRHAPDQLMDILDLGCGTGLCGPLLRPIAAMLGGVDLSGAMIEKAKARGVYDRLLVGDMVDALKSSPETFDMLVAADSLIYLGDLAPVFEAAMTALRRGGLFIFTLEQGEGDRYMFSQETRRFAHARPYVQKLAEMYGWGVVEMEAITPRLHAGKPVAGVLIVLKAPQ